MRSFVMAFLLVMCSFAVRADAPHISLQTMSPTLLQRALQESESDQPARSIGQCLFACGDRIIEVDLCPTGDCPAYDCRTGLAACSVIFGRPDTNLGEFGYDLGPVAAILATGGTGAISRVFLRAPALTRAAIAARSATRVKSALQTPERIIVDSRGNAIPLKEGEYLTRSPDGKWVQVRDANGNPTGMRIDGPHNPRTHVDPRAQEPHAHVPGVTNPDGTPWLPIK
jgi:hypothetical protein